MTSFTADAGLFPSPVRPELVEGLSFTLDRMEKGQGFDKHVLSEVEGLSPNGVVFQESRA